MARTAEKQQRETQTQGDDQSRANQQRQGSQSNAGQQQTGLAQRQQSVPGLYTNPFSLMRRFGTDLEQILNEFSFGGLMPRGMGRMAEWAPQIEMFEQDGQLVIRADLPGLNKDNVQIEVQYDSLVLRGERREEHGEEREGVYRSEVSYGSFYREIPLPDGVDPNKAVATFNDGVLEIRMPVAQGKSRGRRLEIQDSRPGEQPKQRGQAAGAGR